MISRISLLLLLAHGSLVMAQPLYKWKEADGSITFSPSPPAAGISYERLDNDGSRSLIRAENASSTVPATTADVDTESNRALPAALPRIEHAPADDGRLPQAISRSPARTDGNTSLRPIGTALSVQTDGAEQQTAPGQTDHTGIISADSFKRSRCQDLRKRVTSLEQRLRQHLTPEDMDNTIVHMARYQRSHDQYCVQ